MNKILSLISGVAVAAWLIVGAVQAQTSDPTSQLAGATIRVTLEKPLDSKKNKPGDQVIAKSAESIKANGHDVVPRGAKIIGHITGVEAHTKEKPQAYLGIVFDRAILKNGQEVPLRFAIQAVAPSPQNEVPNMSMTPATAAGSAGGLGPVAGPLTQGSTSDPNAGTPGRIASPESPTADNMTSRGELTPSCRGVLRMESMGLVPEDPTLGSVIVSRNRNIQLDIGTQMMLRLPQQ